MSDWEKLGEIKIEAIVLLCRTPEPTSGAQRRRHRQPGRNIDAQCRQGRLQILVNTLGGMVLAPVTLKDIKYDTNKDFYPVAFITSAPDGLTVQRGVAV